MLSGLRDGDAEDTDDGQVPADHLPGHRPGRGSRSFYEALGFEFRRESDIVRNGEREATLYFFAMPGEEVEIELTPSTTTAARTSSAPDTDTSRSASTTSMQRSQPSRRRGSSRKNPPYRVRDGGSRLCFVRDPGIDRCQH